MVPVLSRTLACLIAVLAMAVILWPTPAHAAGPETPAGAPGPLLQCHLGPHGVDGPEELPRCTPFADLRWPGDGPARSSCGGASPQSPLCGPSDRFELVECSPGYGPGAGGGVDSCLRPPR